jgi:hypothetical protein
MLMSLVVAGTKRVRDDRSNQDPELFVVRRLLSLDTVEPTRGDVHCGSAEPNVALGCAR